MDSQLRTQPTKQPPRSSSKGSRNRPWEPLPGTNSDPSLGRTGLFLFNSTVKSPVGPVRPWDGWGFVPGTIVPEGPSEKNYVFSVCWLFFAPQEKEGERRVLVSPICHQEDRLSFSCGSSNKLQVLQVGIPEDELRWEPAAFMKRSEVEKVQAHNLRAEFSGNGMRTATFQFSELGSSPNGSDLFTEFPFL